VTDGHAGGSAGDNDVDGGKTSLLSPAFGTAGDELLISYWRWYSNDAGANPNEDVFEVFITNNVGLDWHLVETVGPDGPETGGGWIYHEFMASDFVTTSPDMMLKFVAADEGNGSLVEAAIDDLAIAVYYCDPAAPGDANHDGLITLEDHTVFTQCLSGPDTTPPEEPPNCLNVFDFDEDQDVDFEDFATFQKLCID
jgi:hypothetical protein